MPSAALMRRFGACLLLSAFTVTTAGCGSDEQADPAGFNQPDAAFATQMAQHHAQTMQLVNLPETRALPASAWAWTEGVRTRRLKELHTLTRLLRSWDQPVPETGMQHADEGKHVQFDTAIAGIAPERDIHALSRLRGVQLRDKWLQLLIEHERGAVELADNEVARGQNAEALEFARADRDRHATLITQLQELAGRSS